MIRQQKIQGTVDSLRERDEELWHPQDARDVLLRFQNCWARFRRFRDERERCMRYTYGDQWSDLIKVGEDSNGKPKFMRESDYLRSIGQTPLQNNLIRRLVRTVLGVYRSQSKEPTCVARDRDEQHLGDVMSTVLQANWQRNKMQEVNARTMEDFLIGGLIVHRKGYGRRHGSCDCWTDYVNPNYFAFDSIARDFRGWDVSLVGEIHDCSFEELVSTFAKTKDDYDRLSQEYYLAKDSKNYDVRYDKFFDANGYNNFLVPADPSVCRVFEIWTLENKSRYHCHDYLNGTEFKCDSEDLDEFVTKENEKRIQMARMAGVDNATIKVAQDFAAYISQYEVPEDGMYMPEECMLITAVPFIDSYWYFRYLTPMGMVLAEGETPFKHEGHPYVFRAYPWINGEIHSFVSDIIDQQRYINRIISQIDLISRASAKGVLMVPKSSIPDSGIDPIKKAWSKPAGVVVYEDNNGRTAAPHQVNAATNTASLENMLVTQQRILEDASGIHGAAQGKPGASSVSGTLYAQQAQNSTMTLLDILDTFCGFEEECAMMDVQNIQQYYEDKRVVAIAGKSANVVFDPQKIKDIIYDIAIGESTSTPAYRQLSQDMYNQWLAAGLIDIEQALEYGNFPNGDALLQDIRTKREEQQKAQEEQAQAQAAAKAQQAQPVGGGQPGPSAPGTEQGPSADIMPEDPTKQYT